MARPNSRPGRSCKTMDETMAVVDEPGTRVPRLYRRWECVNSSINPAVIMPEGNAIIAIPNTEEIIVIIHVRVIPKSFNCFHG